MSKLTIEQLIEALEVAVKHDDLTEFGIVIERLHGYSLERERNKIVQKVDVLADKYPGFDWMESIAGTEPSPGWILGKLPTRHLIKLEGGLYLKLEEFLKKLNSPQLITTKEVETFVDGLLNRLLKDFLHSHQQAEI